MSEYNGISEDGLIEQAFLYVGTAWAAVSGLFEPATRYLSAAWSVFNAMPQPVRVLIYIAVFTACAGVLLAHIGAIVLNSSDWKPFSDKLMYSYFTGTGTHQARSSYAMAHKQIRESTWVFGLSSIAYRWGNINCKSKILTFLMSIVYIPLAVLGLIEMCVRAVLGTVYLVVCKLVHCLVLLATRYISYFLIPLAIGVDKRMRVKQNCTACYVEFDLPQFICQHCGLTHDQLIPGRCGILFARCACNKFMPAMVLTGRSKLRSKCPKCKEHMAASNAKQFFVQLIGGTGTGKTSYLVAFNYAYTEVSHRHRKLYLTLRPRRMRNRLLDTDFLKTDSTAAGEIHAYNFLSSYGKPTRPAKDNLVLFDIAGQTIMADSYERIPRHFGFCHGFVLFFDPLSVPEVRDAAEAEEGSYSTEDFDMVITEFVNRFRAVTGMGFNVPINTPLAVVIAKTDVKAVQEKCGGPGSYKGENYLQELDMHGALRLISSNFSNVRYFCIASTQNEARANQQSLLAPITWLAKESRSKFGGEGLS